jgi:hypothetical protein
MGVTNTEIEAERSEHGSGLYEKSSTCVCFDKISIFYKYGAIDSVKNLQLSPVTYVSFNA